MTRIFQIDAFTGEPFKGNPAAVCILDGPADEGWMQDVAMEMNLSETAFVIEREGQVNGFSLRWFTPTVEVSLCGHATLASAHILWETGVVDDAADIFFSTLGGKIRVWRESELIWMDFPVDRPERVEAPPGLLEALGLSASRAESLEIFKSSSDYLFELKSVREVINVSPDFRALKEIDARGFIVTARGESGDVDFVSRFFAPAYGIDEDPVTGSAHTALAPYWKEKLGKSEFKAIQLSKRGGLISLRMVRVNDSGKDETRVLLGGRAVTVFSSKLS